MAIACHSSMLNPLHVLSACLIAKGGASFTPTTSFWALEVGLSWAHPAAASPKIHRQTTRAERKRFMGSFLEVGLRLRQSATSGYDYLQLRRKRLKPGKLDSQVIELPIYKAAT